MAAVQHPAPEALEGRRRRLRKDARDDPALHVCDPRLRRACAERGGGGDVGYVGFKFINLAALFKQQRAFSSFTRTGASASGRVSRSASRSRGVLRGGGGRSPARSPRVAHTPRRSLRASPQAARTPRSTSRGRRTPRTPRSAPRVRTPPPTSPDKGTIGAAAAAAAAGAADDEQRPQWVSAFGSPATASPRATRREIAVAAAACASGGGGAAGGAPRRRAE